VSDEPGPDPPKAPPVEVVIVAAAAPVPVVIATDPRPDTFTGRPDPLGTDPTIDQLKREREELRRSNDGRFSIEDRPSPAPPAPHPPHPPLAPPAARDPVFAVVAMLVALNSAKLCLLVWVLLTVLQVRADFAEAAAQRAAIATSLASLQAQLDRGVAQQQTLIDRVDDALVRLSQPQPAR
jgi:hypothetical protein